MAFVLFCCDEVESLTVRQSAGCKFMSVLEREKSAKQSQHFISYVRALAQLGLRSNEN